MIVCGVSGLDITYDCIIVKGNTLIIKDIIALGSLSSNLGKVNSRLVSCVECCTVHNCLR